MFQVFLAAEDGEYVMTEAMSESACIGWIRAHEHEYGEGQELFYTHAGGY